VTRTSSLNAIAASLAEKPDATALRREAPGSERSDRSARAVPGPPQPRQGSRRARAGSGHAAAAPPSSVMNSRRLTPSVSRASTKRIAHPLRQETAAPRFQQLMSQMGSKPVVLWLSTRFPLRPQNPTSARNEYAP
jgi:hypothetical protein